MVIEDLSLVILSVICFGVAVMCSLKKVKGKWLVILYTVPAAGSLLHFLLYDCNLFMYIVYIAAVLFLLIGLLHSKRIVHTILCIGLIIINIVVMICPSIMKSGCYASLSYTKAFDKLFYDMKKNYALGGYKDIDWDTLYGKYAPVMKEAQESQNADEYMNALVNYTLEFHDGHVVVADMLEFFGWGSLERLRETKKAHFSSCYDMAVLSLENGDHIAVNVKDSGVAAMAGIQEGDLILEWNGLPVADAINQITEIIPVNCWNFADEENRNLYKSLYLTSMGPDQIIVKYRNKDGNAIEVQMSSSGSGYSFLKETIGKFGNRANQGQLSQGDKGMISYDIYGDVCYLRVSGFGAADDEEIDVEMEEFCKEISDRNLTSLVIDARNNSGGNDEYGAKLYSYFAKEPIIYLKESNYVQENQAFEVRRQIDTEPQNRIQLPVVLLINSQCISAGEGFVYHMSQLPNVTTVGVTGTNGSFGTFEGIRIMPGNLAVHYPAIACLDANDQVMIDSGPDGIGGIKPDIYIPVDRELANELFTTDNDHELDYAIELAKTMGN